MFLRTLIIHRSLCNPKRLSATTGQNLACLTVNTLESIRNDESFNSFYDVILEKVKEHPSVSEPILPRKPPAPSSYELGTSEPHYSSTACDYYRGLYFEAVDCLTSAIKERFTKPAFLVYQNLESLLIKPTKGEDVAKEMGDLSSHFGNDVCPTSLGAQLSTLKVLILKH